MSVFFAAASNDLFLLCIACSRFAARRHSQISASAAVSKKAEAKRSRKRLCSHPCSSHSVISDPVISDPVTNDPVISTQLSMTQSLITQSSAVTQSSVIHPVINDTVIRDLDSSFVVHNQSHHVAITLECAFIIFYRRIFYTRWFSG